jgi:MYXO-CTERM domain-containing protein
VLVASWAGSAEAATPVGELTAVDCETITGWAQDPDQPLNPTLVRLSFGGPAGTPEANEIVIGSDLEMGVGCEPSICDHGFSSPLPMSLLDDLEHPVHAYGVDLTGEGEAELPMSPMSFACAAPSVIGGDKRHMTSPDALAAWGFSIFFDRLPVEDALIAALPEGDPIVAGPMLAVANTSDPSVWWLDGSRRRLVDPQYAAAWRLDLGAATELDVDALAMIPEGTPLPPRPILIQGSDEAVYLFDDHQCVAGDPDPVCQPMPEDTSGEGGGDDSGGGTSAGGGTGGDDAGTAGNPTGTGVVFPADGGGGDGGCSCRADRSGPSAPRWMPWLGLLLMGYQLASRRT